ncbi:hypothetical protein H8F21_13695 [Pseudomonas sp. P66]|uniref:Uncharacterized protein n=1 Tax=Pseudomonas arcuscaelestis TaxID=2710591 RepID=A0ABS2BZY2_9PSED|nr:hypothetical protein [Pseudomonas arcuscaelestis]MBM5458618.1 hypothetical protein [Pseudomonas arcuscaelestis]
MQDNISPATIYSASNPRQAGLFPDSQHDELWIADIKACQPGGACRLFKNVMFVESQGAVYLYGLEHEDGRPREVKPVQADSQQLFVNFVREQNDALLTMIGLLAPVFDGSEYACQARVTAAYMIRREHLRFLAVGYRNRDGDYVREKFEDPDDWLENARAIVPFDTLEVEES